MYLALYRKFRPTNFEQVVGQEHIIKTLKNQIINGQVGHAYLFCGSRGTGKTSVAKIFAKAVNCTNNKDGSPCGACEVCKNLEQANNIDIIEIDAASNNRVDEIRDLKELVKYPPIYGKYKVYIIDEVHMLTDSAFNALLKTLEEPPAHIIFILATTEPQKLPATILSRVLRFDFKLISQDKLFGLLSDIFKKSGIKAEQQAIKMIVKAGGGSVRDSLSIADMCASYSNNNITANDVLEILGTSGQEVLLSLANLCLRGDIHGFVELLDKQVKSGKNIVNLAQEISKTLRDMLVLKTTNAVSETVDLPVENQEQMLKVAKNFSTAFIGQAFEKFSSIELDIKYAFDPQLLLETIAVAVAIESPYFKDDGIAKKNISVEKIDETGSKTENMTEVKKDQTGIQNGYVYDDNQQAQNTTSVGGLKDAQQEEKASKETTPTKIWGQVLIELHKQNPVLHACCVQVTDVEKQGDNFLIEIDSDSILEILKNNENYQELVACFNKLGYNNHIEITKVDAKQAKDKARLLSEQLGVSVNIKK